MKQKQEMNNNDQCVFTTIRISREVYNDLSKRRRYKASHSDIIAKLFESENKLSHFVQTEVHSDLNVFRRK
ncbi:MAG: antitoxin VapB family protein [Nitrososphaeraceae archaeon]